MRVAAIYDIHADYSALKAVLEEIRKTNVDRVIVGGNLSRGTRTTTGYGSFNGL